MRIKQDKRISMNNMWNAYGDFKELYNFYLQHRYKVSAQEMRDRVAYIMKRGCNQRTEIETICWILGEDLVGEKEDY